MATGLLAGSIRAVARAAIPGFLKQGLTANAIIRQLMPMGLTYRRVAMLADIRQFSGLAKLEGAVRRLDPAKLFPQYTMVESDYRSARRYLVRARMVIEDAESLEQSERWVSFYTNKRMSKDQWTEAFVAGYAHARYAEGESIISVSIASVEHKKGWGY